MAQMNKQEEIDTEIVDEHDIKSQDGSELAVEGRASVPSIKSFDPVYPFKRQFVSSQQPSNATSPRIDLEYSNYGEESYTQTVEPPRTQEKKLGFSRGARMARFQWMEEEKKQIALGIHSSEEIPTIVEAITKEVKRQRRKELKLRKRLEIKAESPEAKNKPQSMGFTSASGDGDDGF
ncbi:uncharacterized protein EAE98_010151 [Botrytis deweyae]|uniref:Uncharacterized protein n=1 Tax=Botrytis deweyae TaxID=2478750 RepID=A0ABQ7I990_9HELO|nr:uncharacterized protein EAE98_010151 [Botrytis deweyae]KAF7917388.1 hypothetical protein EAE98_010151 [Botrytis deweyae]